MKLPSGKTIRPRMLPSTVLSSARSFSPRRVRSGLSDCATAANAHPTTSRRVGKIEEGRGKKLIDGSEKKQRSCPRHNFYLRALLRLIRRISGGGAFGGGREF